MKLGANKGVGLVLVSLTALITGGGAVTATPSRKADDRHIEGRAKFSITADDPDQ